MKTSIKKILIDMTPIRPGGENGGAKLVIFQLLSYLAELAPRTEFILLAQKEAYSELSQFKQPNISCQVVSYTLGKQSFLARALAYALRRIPRIPNYLSALGHRFQARTRRHAARHVVESIQPDLLFCPLTAPTYSIPGIPTICTIHDLQYKTYPMFFDPADLIHREQTFIEACQKATLLVTVSEYSRQSVLQHSSLDPTRVITVHSRLASRMLGEEVDQTIFTRLDLEHKQYFIYPANYWLHKNHEILITAFNMACHREEFPSTMKLVCTGAANERQHWLQKAAQAMGLGTRILFTDYLTNTELAALMQHSCGMVFPSLYEGFGLPVLEAMAAGIPVACSDTRSLPEIAGDAAYFFDPRIPEQIADALIHLTLQADTRQRLIQAGRERVHLFSNTAQMATEYWQVFQQAHAITSQAEVL